MKNKLSSYQKIKKKKQELHKSLRIVCLYPTSIEAIKIIMHYKLEKRIEDAIMFGEPSISNKFKGLIPQIIDKI